MQSLYRVSLNCDARDLFPIGVANNQYHQARRQVHLILRDNFGVIFDADTFDGTTLVPGEGVTALYIGACALIRRNRGWAVYSHVCDMNDEQVANNYGMLAWNLFE